MKNAGASAAPPSAAVAAKQLGLFGFFAITASMVMAVYAYPTFATSGFSLVFFLLVGGLLWFIPVALCSAEMATVEGWEDGGVFAWVSNTLGERWGFAAISFTYLEIAIGFIPMMYFVLGALSYILAWPELNTDPGIKAIACLIIVWGLAATQLGGTKYTAGIAKAGFLGGIITPALILVALAILHVASGSRLEIEMDASTFFPDFTSIGTLVVFVAFILSYMGVEASATHVNEMKNPGRDYPLAMFLLMVVAIGLSSIGGLAVAAVIPNAQINLSAGVVQTFEALLLPYGAAMEWVVRILAALLVLGVSAEITSWIVGPARGMYVTAQRGILPASMAKVNKNGVPVALVAFQLVLTSIAVVVLTLGGGGSNESFLIALALTVVLYLITYFLLFLGYIALVLKHADKKRVYNVPGGKAVKLIVAGTGFVVSVLAFIVSFFPPSGLAGMDADRNYVLLLMGSFIVVFVIPFIVYELHDKRGKLIHARRVRITADTAPHQHFWLHPRARGTHHLEPLDTPQPVKEQPES